MYASAVIKWLGSAVFLAIAINILSNLLSPYVSDWLANASGKRAQNKVNELSCEERIVEHLVKKPYELWLWAAYSVLRALMWLVAALLFLSIGVTTLLLKPIIFPQAPLTIALFFGQQVNTPNVFAVGLVLVVTMILSNCLSRVRTVARMVFAVSHHQEYLPALKALKHHYWQRIQKSRC